MVEEHCRRVVQEKLLGLPVQLQTDGYVRLDPCRFDQPVEIGADIVGMVLRRRRVE